jgi:hypothetical protein
MPGMHVRNTAKGVPNKAEISFSMHFGKSAVPYLRIWHTFCFINHDHGHMITPPQVASRAALPPFFSINPHKFNNNHLKTIY